MKTPPDVSVSLFAAEPDLRNPTAMDIDAQGRVWITEAVNYRLFKHEVADDLGDRIRVLEDTDGDGRCDKAWTYYQDPSLQAPLGIAVLGDRVYVCQSPDLFYLEDTDGDGRADRKTVILTGFGGVDHDHAIHGLHFGPDGWLYLSVGDGGLDVTDKSGNRVVAGKAGKGKPAASVLRCDLDGKHIEMVAWGMRNPYEPAINSFGTLFVSDNDDDGNRQCQFNYIMEGANYGYWPRRRGDKHDAAVHWNKDLPGVMPNVLGTGFGSPCGLHVYEGHHLPNRLLGTILHADAGPGVIRAYTVHPEGAGYRGEIEILLSCEEDKWFRPSDICVAPDGSVFVADWYDPGVGGHNMKDTAQGRIYRLARPGAEYAVHPPAITSPEEAVAALRSPNRATRFLAWQRLAQAGEGGNTSALEGLYQSKAPHLRARALWLLSQSAAKRMGYLDRALRDPSIDIQVQAIRILCRQGDEGVSYALAHAVAANAQVRRQLLVEIARLNHRHPLLDQLRDQWLDQLVDLAVQIDVKDRFYREAVGIAFRGIETEAYATIRKRLGNQWSPQLAQFAIQLHPESALEGVWIAATSSRLPIELKQDAIKALDAIGTAASGAKLIEALTANSEAECRQLTLHLLARSGGDIWREAMQTANIDDLIPALLDEPDLTEATYSFIAAGRRKRMLPHLFARTLESVRPTDDRLRALDCIHAVLRQEDRRRYPLPKEDLLTLLHQSNRSIQDKALKILGLFNTNEAQQLLFDLLIDTALPKDLRSAGLNVLAESESGQLRVMGAVEEDTFPLDLQLQASELAHSSRYEDVRLMAGQLLPREQSADGTTLPPLTELVAMTGDAKKGRDVFLKTGASQCYKCHLVQGEGGTIGPDLSLIGKKLSKEALLESILNPSAAIAPEYEVWLFNTEDEGFVSGIIHSESEEAIELIDALTNITRIETKDILERRKTTTSLMPTGLTAGLSVEELTDLVAFLTTLK